MEQTVLTLYHFSYAPHLIRIPNDLKYAGNNVVEITCYKSIQNLMWWFDEVASNLENDELGIESTHLAQISKNNLSRQRRWRWRLLGRAIWSTDSRSIPTKGSSVKGTRRKEGHYSMDAALHLSICRIFLNRIRYYLSRGPPLLGKRYAQATRRRWTKGRATRFCYSNISISTTRARFRDLYKHMFPPVASRRKMILISFFNPCGDDWVLNKSSRVERVMRKI